MKIFALMGDLDYEDTVILDVYSSEEEAINTMRVYTRDSDMGFDNFCIHRRNRRRPAETDFDGYRKL